MSVYIEINPTLSGIDVKSTRPGYLTCIPNIVIYIIISHPRASKGAFQCPSVPTVHRDIAARVKVVKTLLKQQMRTAGLVSLTADLWSHQARSYLGVTGHWLGEGYERVSAALAIKRLEGRHTYDVLADALFSIMDDYELPVARVASIVTDNGSNFVKAFRVFSSEAGQFEQQSYMPYFVNLKQIGNYALSLKWRGNLAFF